MSNNYNTDIWGAHSAEYSIDTSITWSAKNKNAYDTSKKILAACKINNKYLHAGGSIYSSHAALWYMHQYRIIDCNFLRDCSIKVFQMKVLLG